VFGVGRRLLHEFRGGTTTMRISDLELTLVEIPSSGDSPVRSLLVRLVTDSGLAGWGETAADWRTDQLDAVRHSVLPAIAGHGVFDVEELLALDVLAQPQLASAVEMALWDLIGRAVGQPLCHLWGGAFRRRVPLAVRVPAGPVDDTVQFARELAEQGFHTQVLATSDSVETDVAAACRLRQALGDGVQLRLDAAAALDADSARALCRELEDVGVQFLLDPLEGRQMGDVAALARETNLPLAVSIGAGGPAEVLALVRGRVVSRVAVGPSRVGGITAARKCITVAEAGQVSIVLGRCDSVGIATAAMVHLAAATPALSLANESSCHQLHDDVLVERLEVADGMIFLPQGPGLGVEVDRAKVERHQLTWPRRPRR